MYDAVADLFLHEALHRSHDQRVDVRPLAADEALRPLRLEPLLDLAEHQLDRVQLALVWQVKQPSNVQLLHPRLRLLGPVHRQIIHEQTDLLLAVRVPHHLQVLEELLDVHRLLEHPVLLDAIFGGDAHQQRLGPLIQEPLVDGHVFVLGRPLVLHHGLAGEHSLIKCISL